MAARSFTSHISVLISMTDNLYSQIPIRILTCRSPCGICTVSFGQQHALRPLQFSIDPTAVAMSRHQSKRDSRNEFISILTSYYEFLVGLYLPPSVIKYPRPDGWPRVTPETLSFLNKNDTILDLIKHMPFVSRDSSHDVYQIYDKIVSDRIKKSFGIPSANSEIADPMLEMTVVPAYVMTIARTSGGRDGFYFLCDTERWTITICDFQVRAKDWTDLTQVCRSTNFPCLMMTVS